MQKNALAFKVRFLTTHLRWIFIQTLTLAKVTTNMTRFSNEKKNGFWVGVDASNQPWTEHSEDVLEPVLILTVEQLSLLLLLLMLLQSFIENLTDGNPLGRAGVGTVQTLLLLLGRRNLLFSSFHFRIRRHFFVNVLRFLIWMEVGDVGAIDTGSLEPPIQE